MISKIFKSAEFRIFVFVLFLILIFSAADVLAQEKPVKSGLYIFSNGSYSKVEPNTISITKWHVDLVGKEKCITLNSDNDKNYENSFGELEIFRAEDIPSDVVKVSSGDQVYLVRAENSNHDGWYVLELEKNAFHGEKEFVAQTNPGYDYYLLGDQGLYTWSENSRYLRRSCGFMFYHNGELSYLPKYSKKKYILITNELFPSTEQNVNYLIEYTP